MLTDPMLRDLAWLLHSPSLLRAQLPVGVLAQPLGTAVQAAQTLDWLRALDADAGAAGAAGAAGTLHRAIADAHVTRLGRYAETLLVWFLQNGPVALLVAANIALRRAGVTLGECDFLVETNDGRRLHWELAVKCYLHAGDGRALLADYVGPNLQDRFDRKLAHLLGHQLPLSAREEFASLGHVGPWDAQMLVKGWLFYRQQADQPVDAYERSIVRGAGEEATDEATDEPVELDPAHLRGWWATRTDWPAFAAAHAPKWRVLPRLEWLAPRRYQPAEPAVAEMTDAAQLAPRLTQHTGPTMVAGFDVDGNGRWCERSRGFVVPDTWPARALVFARE
ncbi:MULTISPECIES: DUF1853 family protein [Paraburkholderia]|nr:MULTISPECIES: DUF1853 family protein [Paraburkholderia]MCX4162109.1 DUF1853 family protein [Paraburkholderia megapolitana]MDN7157604.1 DUF1853 family protein [Paraburkholderia sp. CHISQ3]MDQ6494651.1 DUF1853 family protein [Paraburkholderia megapolitana]